MSTANRWHDVTVNKLRDGELVPTGTERRAPGSLVAIAPNEKVDFVEETAIFGRANTLQEASNIVEAHAASGCLKCALVDRYWLSELRDLLPRGMGGSQ